MSILTSIFLGLVQGITEFLPVSSSGHLSIFQNLFKLDYTAEEHLLFDVLLHLGTLGAIFAVYWKDIKTMVPEAWAAITGRDDSEDYDPEERVQHHDADEGRARGADAGEREARDFQDGRPGTAAARDALPNPLDGVMKAAALEKRNPEDDGVDDGKANAAADDFRQGLLYEKSFQSHFIAPVGCDAGIPLKNSFAQGAIADGNPLVGAQFRRSDWSTRMQPVGADAHDGPHAVVPAA